MIGGRKSERASRISISCYPRAPRTRTQSSTATIEGVRRSATGTGCARGNTAPGFLGCRLLETKVARHQTSTQVAFDLIRALPSLYPLNENNPMSQQRTLGLILLAGGGVLLYFGLTATGSIAESVKEGVTGKYSDKTTWYIVGGAAAALAGAGLTFFGGRGLSRE